jgi:phage portal protein BeeE
VRPIDRIGRGRKARSLSFGGGNGTFDFGPFWSREVWNDDEDLDASFIGHVSNAYKANGVVFACVLARLMVFSEARFQFQRIIDGRPGDLFGTQELGLLENPWQNGTTGELLARMEQDISLAGNFYATLVDDENGRRIRRLRPDWVTIITGSKSGSPTALDARVVGYMYAPQEGVDIPDPLYLAPSQVAHWSPIPDPDAQWRGMSWLTPVVREIQADNAATKHKQKYFDNGTVGGVVVKYDGATSPDAVTRFAEIWKQTHSGVDNAYKTIHLGGGADVTTLGADLKQLDFKVTQGAGETRIAAASGVGAVIAQLSEGLQGSSLNAGNFSAAKRRFADGTLRPNWRSAAAALASLVEVPAGARLWYDARDVAFLQEDQKDEAQIQSTQASTIRQLVDAGFTPDEVVKAVTAGDLRSLVGKHSGLYSVQLREAGADEAQGSDS